jgi:bifunctional non-homologous end joining protein LigD
MNDRLKSYRAKRDFKATPEPEDDAAALAPAVAPAAPGAFVIQKHDATRLHYDVRLELDGAMLSWAVPKGPSLDPADKRMAIRTEDHPIAYNRFEGTIPKGQYGAGTVIVWDRGTWTPVGDPHAGLAAGKLIFDVQSKKLRGRWEFVRTSKPGEKENWFLFKKRDAHARPRSEYDVIVALPDSVGPGDDGPAAEPARAKRAPLPDRIAPQLATAAASAPSGGAWICEIKFDGYRIGARIDGGDVRLITRGGHDWSDRMPHLVAALKTLKLESAWLDGEVVVLEDGLPHFNRLQNAFDRRRTGDISCFLFDVPYLNGLDLRAVPLVERRALLQPLLANAPECLRFSEAFEVAPAQMLASACRMGLEGVMVKRADAPYVSDRSDSWLKLKCSLRQEFVVGGWIDRNGEPDAAEVGSLLLGYFEGDALVFAGGCGTGWDAKTASELKKRLRKLETKAAPFSTPVDPSSGRWSRRVDGEPRWVEPTLVVEVSFSGWTPELQLRHAKFEGVREDKPARLVGRDPPPKAAPTTSGGVRVTHPERVIDASSAITKLELVRYYESVAEWILPHLRGRPCSLVRGPEGVEGELFFQKHPETLRIPGLKTLDASLWPGHAALLEVATADALASAAQMNVIEFHTWNSTVKHIDQPDRIVFDLDPGEGVAWSRVQEAATLTRGLLQELGLRSWLKTSGGKGLHVVVPIAPKHDQEVVKELARAVVLQLAKVIPDRFTARSGAANRVGRIFVDYLRNNHGATTAAAYSARARPGLGVSMPIPWEDLGSVKSGAQWTVATARHHLSFHTGDPWAGYWKSRQGIAKARKVLGV